jgi:hypothetical protein
VAYKQVAQYTGSPDPHGDRQWRCESETAGRILRTQATRKRAFTLIQRSSPTASSFPSPRVNPQARIAALSRRPSPPSGYYAWQVLKGRLRQKGYETAGWATGTPHGRDSYARDFELARRPGHALYRASTYANAHNLPPGYVEELGYTGAFAQQEVLGLFVAFEGLVYAFDPSPQGHVREPDPGKAWSRVIGGVEWSYTNPAAALVFALDGDGRAWLLDEFYQRRAGLEETLLPALLDLTCRFGVATWFCGSDEPEHIDALNAALAREGLKARAVRADNAVRAGIQTVTLLAPRPDGTRGLYVAPRFCLSTVCSFGRSSSLRLATCPMVTRSKSR